jgi:ubiquitin-conjugating enzyme E2 variant
LLSSAAAFTVTRTSTSTSLQSQSPTLASQAQTQTIKSRTVNVLLLSMSANEATTSSSLSAVSVAEDVESHNNKSYLDDGFVYGLEGSGLERPKGKVANVVVEGDSLETTPLQVAVVTGTFMGHAAFATHAVQGMLSQSGGNVLFTLVQTLLLVVSSWVLADFGSGVLHWSVDNYGNGRTPIMGGIIAAFQGHHSAPWTITQRGFCNNVYKLCIPFGLVPVAAINWMADPATTFFFTTFCAFEIASQEFHKWSHMTKGECPGWVNWLQTVGLTVPKKTHALHHMAPYEGNYCIISGVCNKALDEFGIFRWMEHQIFRWNGVESNAWKLDPELKERTLREEYSFVTKK